MKKTIKYIVKDIICNMYISKDLMQLGVSYTDYAGHAHCFESRDEAIDTLSKDAGRYIVEEIFIVELTPKKEE